MPTTRERPEARNGTSSLSELVSTVLSPFRLVTITIFKNLRYVPLRPGNSSAVTITISGYHLTSTFSRSGVCEFPKRLPRACHVSNNLVQRVANSGSFRVHCLSSPGGIDAVQTCRLDELSPGGQRQSDLPEISLSGGWMADTLSNQNPRIIHSRSRVLGGTRLIRNPGLSSFLGWGIRFLFFPFHCAHCLGGRSRSWTIVNGDGESRKRRAH